MLARALTGVAQPSISPTAADLRLAVSALPSDEPTAARWAVASMELGALICTARTPRCADCPIRSRCAWVLAGSPPYDGPPRRGQTYEGTDRQVRGRVLSVLRAATGPVADGLVEPLAQDTFGLPG